MDNCKDHPDSELERLIFLFISAGLTGLNGLQNFYINEANCSTSRGHVDSFLINSL